MSNAGVPPSSGSGLEVMVGVSGFAPVREGLSGRQKAVIAAGVPVVALAATA